MDDRVIPAQKVLELLSSAAARRGLNALTRGRGVIVMCAACYPHQPERLEYSARRVHPLPGRTDTAPWAGVLHELCDGYSWIQYPRTLRDNRALILVSDAVDALDAETCCHVEDAALGGWDWRSELVASVEEAVADDGDEWSEEYDRLSKARAEARARDEAARQVATLSQQLPPKLRVQAFAAVLKAAGRRPVVEQARVSWECGHSDDEGRWMRVSYVLDPEQGMVPAHDTCRLHDDDEANEAALVAEYQRVVDMTEEERAEYKPVPEKAAGSWRRGGFGAKTGGRSAAKAEPKKVWTNERVQAFFQEHSVSLELGVQTLFTKAKEIGMPHPPREIIADMKRDMKRG